MTPLYEERFPRGTRVTIAPVEDLLRFRLEWGSHNPLTDEQLRYAQFGAVVAEVGFYHGGDVLYVLESVPGVWHEECLRSASALSP